MFNLFDKCKVYLYFLAFIILFSYICLLKYQNLKLENDKLLLQSKVAAYDIAINAANEMQSRQKENLRFREQDAAQARAESYKRRDMIINASLSEDCADINNWMIDQALGFTWHNSIP